MRTNYSNYRVLIHQVRGIRGLANNFDTIEEAMTWAYKRSSELDEFEVIEVKRLGDPHTYEGRKGKIIGIING